MARVATHVLAALTQVVMDTSLCPKKYSNMFCEIVVIRETIFFFSLVCFACTSNESKSLKIFTQKYTC
jgi:hypothetical protein